MTSIEGSKGSGLRSARLALAVISEGSEYEELRLDWSPSPAMLTITVNRLHYGVGEDGNTSTEPAVKSGTIILSPAQLNTLALVLRSMLGVRDASEQHGIPPGEPS